MLKKYFIKEIIPVIILVVGISLSSKRFIKDEIDIPPFIPTHYIDHRYDSLIERLDTLMLNGHLKNFFPGAAVTIVKDNQTIFTKCYGVKKYNGSDSINLNTVFRLGSVSKSFAAVLAGIMVKQGYFHWDDTIKHFLPEFQLMNKEYEKQLTIRHVLSQTTGLPMHAYTVLLDDGIPYERIKPLLCSIPSIGPPGEYYSYQNVAYSLIADVMKSLTNKEYDELLMEKLFTPFGMKDASANYESISQNNNSALPHVKLKNGTWLAEKHNERYYSVGPAAGVNASISDMAYYLKAMMGLFPETMDTAIINEVFTPQIKSNIKWKYKRNWKQLNKVYYALGWRVFDYGDQYILFHSGYVRGYKAEIAIIPSENIGMAILFNGASNFESSCISTFMEDYLAWKKGNEKQVNDTTTSDTTFIYSHINI